VFGPRTVIRGDVKTCQVHVTKGKWSGLTKDHFLRNGGLTAEGFF